jgi:hypothetical protein
MTGDLLGTKSNFAIAEIAASFAKMRASAPFFTQAED